MAVVSSSSSSPILAYALPLDTALEDNRQDSESGLVVSFKHHSDQVLDDQGRVRTYANLDSFAKKKLETLEIIDLITKTNSKLGSSDFDSLPDFIDSALLEKKDPPQIVTDNSTSFDSLMQMKLNSDKLLYQFTKELASLIEQNKLNRDKINQAIELINNADIQAKAISKESLISIINIFSTNSLKDQSLNIEDFENVTNRINPLAIDAMFSFLENFDASKKKRFLLISHAKSDIAKTLIYAFKFHGSRLKRNLITQKTVAELIRAIDQPDNLEERRTETYFLEKLVKSGKKFSFNDDILKSLKKNSYNFAGRRLDIGSMIFFLSKASQLGIYDLKKDFNNSSLKLDTNELSRLIINSYKVGISLKKSQVLLEKLKKDSPCQPLSF